MSFYRVTTPQHTFTLPFSTSECSVIQVTYTQGGVQLVKEYDGTLPSGMVLDDDTVIINLTQEETKQFKVGTVSAQVTVQLPISGGGTATFTEITDTTATASDVSNTAYFYTAAGVRTQGTNSGGGGGSGLTLLKTYSMGALSTSSTSATDTGKSTTLTGYNDYDVLVVDVSVDSLTNGRHTSTVSMVYLTGTSTVSTKNTYTVGSNKWNSKLSSSGTGSTRQSTSAYGIYVNAATVSSSTMTLTFYYRYNSNNTGTINGNYTARIYGLKLYDLIGG